MTAEQNASTLLLETWPYRDKDLIVRCFTADSGAFSAMAYAARTSRKRFPSGLDRLTIGDAQFSQLDRNMPTLKSFDATEVFWTVKQDLNRTAVATVLAELLMLSHLDKADSTRLFNYAQTVYQALEKGTLDGSIASAVQVIIRFLQTVNFFPDRLSCPGGSDCNLTTEAWLETHSGALFCRHHIRSRREALQLSHAHLKFLARLNSSTDLPVTDTQAPRTDMVVLLEHLQLYLAQLLGRDLKALAFLLDLSRW